jgi:lipopolysaccharide biosynthesis glycosyltransferase
VTDAIDIAFGFDANYAPHAAGVMAAVRRFAPGVQLRFIILHEGVEPELRRQMETVAPDATWLWREIVADDFPAFTDRGHINRSTLFRLGLEKHAPADCRRVLYLDADLAILSDVRPLWQTDLQGKPIAAVVDAYLDAAEFARRWGLEGEGAYFNAGVLLIDLEQVRRERLFVKAIEFIAAHEPELPYSDQDALNHVFWRNWRELDVAWNVQRFQAMPETARDLPEHKRLHGAPAIVHFMGAEKPWLPGVWHPWAWTYWRNLAWTPFTGMIAEKYGVGALQRARLWLRWLRRRPAAAR